MFIYDIKIFMYYYLIRDGDFDQTCINMESSLLSVVSEIRQGALSSFLCRKSGFPETMLPIHTNI